MQLLLVWLIFTVPACIILSKKTSWCRVLYSCYSLSSHWAYLRSLFEETQSGGGERNTSIS